MNIYYVYAYLRENQTPYYIGKGKGYRAWERHYCEVPKDRSRIVMLAENLDENQAYDLEEELILQIGREDLGTGPLLNRNKGGRGNVQILFGKDNGMTGLAHSEDTKERIRKSKLGKPRLNNKTITCSICASVMKPQAYRTHCLKHHPESPLLDQYTRYSCKYCDKKYATAPALRTHIGKIHPGCDFVKLVNYPARADQRISHSVDQA